MIQILNNYKLRNMRKAEAMDTIGDHEAANVYREMADWFGGQIECIKKSQTASSKKTT